MSRERAIKNCVACYELAKQIISSSPTDQMDLKRDPSLITLFNNALRAAEGMGAAGSKGLSACMDCNFTEPRIANELRKSMANKS